MTPESRNRQLRQIKAAGKEFFRDESGAYSEALEREAYCRLTGTTHCRCMTDAQLRQVGDYLARGTGHKPDKKVALRPSSSMDLVARLEAFDARPAPAGWRLHPLRTRLLWKRCTGLESAVPFAHLDTAQQNRLHRALIAIWNRAERPLSGTPRRRRGPAKPPTIAPGAAAPTGSGVDAHEASIAHLPV